MNHKPMPDAPADDEPADDPPVNTGHTAERAMPTLKIVAPGPLATVQDAGRAGYAHLGVGRSGAADATSLAAANRLVGNAPGAAGIETTMGGLTVLARATTSIAVTGPPTTLTIDGALEPSHCRIRLSAGRGLTVSPPSTGLRNYVAVRGGIVAVDSGDRHTGRILGSLATDLLSGLGPPPLNAGDGIETGTPAEPLPHADRIPHAAPRPGRIVGLPIVRGPRDHWFTAASRRLLTGQEWTVTQDADRVGVRLSGPEPLARSRADELASEPMVAGALQIPPDGQPVLFLADHPVTGGYPVIAVLRDSAVPTAAQLRPGDAVFFTD